MAHEESEDVRPGLLAPGQGLGATAASSGAAFCSTPSEEEPLQVLMMTDDVAGIGLWDQSVSYDEEELPLSEDVRLRVRQWVDEYTATIGGENAHWREDELYAHDRRGYALSHDVQRALGPKYRIEYVCETARLRQELSPSAADDKG